MTGERLYFDNAATSCPKAPSVASAVAGWLQEIPASPGRGAYAEVQAAAQVMADCRSELLTLIGGSGSPDQVIFTLNCTDALTLAIEGVCRAARRAGRRPHVVTTVMDHNSVLRPLHDLGVDGGTATRVAADPDTGLVNPDEIASAITDDTVLVVVNHGSNVCGALQPVAPIGAICREAGVLFCVDAAQSLGHRPVNVEAMQIDLLAFPGHKGLLGPLGTGGLWIRPGVEHRVAPVRLGGTGSRSELDRQPDELPDRYEAGSHNMPGIVGLQAAVSWINARGPERLYASDASATEAMLETVCSIDGLTLIGPRIPSHRCGVFSVSLNAMSPAALARRLEQRDGILSRAGLHCAPEAHRTLGTFNTGGTCRLSIGPFTSERDIDAVGEALRRAATQRIMVAATA